MSLDINTFIFVGFLIANLVLGLASSRGIKTIREYAIGDRNFSTAVIVSTIVATRITGTFFFTIASESYRDGLYYIWGAIFSDLVCFLLIAYIFAPRMGEFLGKLSIAEAMGSIYGDRVRIITAIFGFIGVAGIISVQLKVAGITFEYALKIPSGYGTIIAGLLVTVYSSLGGIKAVTFTDVIQFITFGAVMPVIAYFLLNSLGSIDALTTVISTNPLFNFKEVFDFSQAKPVYFLFLFLFYAMPGFAPVWFQRISMAGNIPQVIKSFSISAFTCCLLGLSTCFIGVLVFVLKPNIDANDVIKTIITDYSHVPGLNGLILVGIMAMILSTADSYINSTSVMVVHDFFKPLRIKIFSKELSSARIISFIIGIVSIALSLRQGSLVKLMISAQSFYMPIVTVPFMMAVFGFRSTAKSVILGMCAGLITVLMWIYFDIQIVDNVIPAMFVNLVVLVGSHYLLKQKGGWVGIKDPAPLQAIRMKRRLKFQQFIRAVKNFNFIDACYENRPKGDGLTSILGAFVMITTFSSVNLMPAEFRNQYQYLLDIFYPIAIASSSPLMSYPLWLYQWQQTRAIGIVWNLIAFFVLICFSCLMVFISDFSEMPLVSFLINVLLISSLVSWRWALSSIVLGVTLVTFCYSHFIAGTPDIFGSQTKIVYLVLLISSSIILFLKPKQDQHELTEESNIFLSDKVEDQKLELIKLSELKYEFLRNIEHEAHTPITGITSMGQILEENYHRLTEAQRQLAIKDIASSSERLSSLVNNLIDMSKLDSLNYKLDKTKINLAELIYKRLDICQRLYLKGKEHLNFDVKIDDGVFAECDPYYIARTIDNMIINAIQYSKDGTISISLFINEAQEVVFSVQDNGIGIPQEELYDIFGAFVVSSKTKTPAGGRGIGLALCKKVIECHGGRIWAESDHEQGAKVTFVIPALSSKRSKPLRPRKQRQS